MKFLIITSLMLLLVPVSSFAKVIAKKDVARIFAQSIESCACTLKDYELDEKSVEISNTENILAIFTEPGLSLFEDGDIYEIHADFYKGGDRFHLNYMVIVKYLGLFGDQRHHYTFDTENMDPPFYKMDGNSRAKRIKGSFDIKYSWKEKSKLWN